MITAIQDEFGQYHVSGNEADEKPIGKYPGNSMFEEMDTGNKFYYDAQAKEWKPYSAD